MGRRMMLLAFLLLCTTAALNAQAWQGWIQGRVRPATRTEALEGVEITLTGGAGAIRLSTSTDAAGNYHFLALAPGDYDLRFEKPGYAQTTVLTVKVTSGRASIVDVRLENGGGTAVVAWLERPKDLWALGYGDSFDATRLAALPSARNIWGVLENQSRSAVTNEPQEGGFATGVIALVGALGASWTQNSYWFDAINVTDPFDTGKPLVYPDYSGLQEFQAVTALHSPAVASPGVAFRMTSPESSRDLHMSAEGYYQGEPLQSSNLDRRLRSFGFTDIPHFKRFGEGEFVADGAIPGTKSWSFLSSFGVQHLSRELPGFSAIPVTTVESALLHFDGALSSRDRLALLSTGQIVDNSNLGAAAGMAPTATLLGHDRYEVVQGHWTHYQGNNLVWQVHGGFSHASPTDTFQHGITEANRTQLFTGEMSGAAPLESDSARSRFSLAGWGEAWVRFARRQHQLDFGVDLEESKATEERRLFGDFIQLYYPQGVPSEVIEYNTTSHTKLRLRELSIYLGDRVQVFNRLFVRAGVSLDSSNAFLPPQQSAAGSYVQARQFPGLGSVVAWTTLAPRVGISIPLFERFGGTRLLGGYSRYYHVLPANYANYANPTSLGGWVFRWNDLNHDGLFQRGEEGPLLRVFGEPFSSVDPALKRPYTDEFALGLSQQIGKQLFLEALGFHRDQRRLVDTVNVGVPFTAYTPLPVLDIGNDNVPGTSDDLVLTIYNQDARTLGHDQYLLTNPPGLNSSYKGLEVSVQQNLAQRGFLSLSFTASKAVGATNPGNTVFDNDPGVVGSLYDNPNNLLNARGRIFFDRAYTSKIAAYVQLPLGLHAGTVVRYADGLPFGRELIVTGLNQGPIFVMATPRGEPGGFRTQYYLSFDQRIAREFSVGRFKLMVMADAFNLLNSNRNLREYDISGSLFPPRTPMEIQNPRVIRLGLRLAR
jgi:hypothetical protein